MQIIQCPSKLPRSQSRSESVFLIAAVLAVQTHVAEQQHTVNRVKVTSEGSGPVAGASHITQPPSLFLSRSSSSALITGEAMQRWLGERVMSLGRSIHRGER